MIHIEGQELIRIPNDQFPSVTILVGLYDLGITCAACRLSPRKNPEENQTDVSRNVSPRVAQAFIWKLGKVAAISMDSSMHRSSMWIQVVLDDAVDVGCGSAVERTDFLGRVATGFKVGFLGIESPFQSWMIEDFDFGNLVFGGL